MPTNYHIQRVISVVWGLLAVVALGMKIFRDDNMLLSKILLNISVFGGMIHLFFSKLKNKLS